MKTIRDEYVIAMLAGGVDPTRTRVTEVADGIAQAACAEWGHLPEYSHASNAYVCARCGRQVDAPNQSP